MHFISNYFLILYQIPIPIKINPSANCSKIEKAFCCNSVYLWIRIGMIPSAGPLAAHNSFPCQCLSVTLFEAIQIQDVENPFTFFPGVS